MSLEKLQNTNQSGGKNKDLSGFKQENMDNFTQNHSEQHILQIPGWNNKFYNKSNWINKKYVAPAA